MTEQEMLSVLEQKLKRLQAAEECRNLMGKYSYYHTSSRNWEYLDLWAKREDDILVMPFGTFYGYEGVKQCYVDGHGDRSDPKTLDFLRGGVFMHEMDTEVLEVAEDGQTAKGAWMSPGHETYVDRFPGGDGKPHAEWCWGKYGVDFIRDEDGSWKIWHMRLYPLFKCEYGHSWVDAEQPNQDGFPPMEGAHRAPKAWVYSADAVYPADEPPVPFPYRTFDDVGITIRYKED